MKDDCITNIIHSFIMAVLLICATIWISVTVELNDYLIWLSTTPVTSALAIFHIVRFIANLHKYIVTAEESEMAITHTGWVVSYCGKSYTLSDFPGEVLGVRGFFRGNYRVEKPLNYMGKCRLMIVDRHPETGRKISFTRENVVYYIDENGEHHIVNGAEKDVDTLNLGKIRAEYELYINGQDFYDAYPEAGE